jgi:hypothetical protein
MAIFNVEFSFTLQTLILLGIVGLRLGHVISEGLTTVLVILLCMLVVFDLILSGTWVWGGTKSTETLMALVLNVLCLMYIVK